MSDAELNAFERACALQDEASRSFEAGEERAALGLNRKACAGFRVAMEATVAPESMWRYLLALQGLSVAAAVTGEVAEARLAVGTAITNVSVACTRWPGPPFDGLSLIFDELVEKLGGDCTAYVSDDPESWPFGD